VRLSSAVQDSQQEEDVHVHVSAIDGFIVGLYMLIWLFIFRWASIALKDTPIGKALAAIH